MTDCAKMGVNKDDDVETDDKRDNNRLRVTNRYCKDFNKLLAFYST